MGTLNSSCRRTNRVSFRHRFLFQVAADLPRRTTLQFRRTSPLILPLVPTQLSLSRSPTMLSQVVSSDRPCRPWPSSLDSEAVEAVELAKIPLFPCFVTNPSNLCLMLLCPLVAK